MSVTINNPLTILLQQAQASGKKFTTGTVIFATANGKQRITHNLGVVPEYFFMIVKDKSQFNFTFEAEDRAPAGLYGAYIPKAYWGLNEYVNGENITVGAGGFCLEWRNNNSTALAWSNNSTLPFSINETTATVSYRSASYVYHANVEFEWIAVE